jgi:serine-type D-Ala-D-Ala carboxypeptidase/endopeptidase (penicillin-binding protein 4)
MRRILQLPAQSEKHPPAAPHNLRMLLRLLPCAALVAGLLTGLPALPAAAQETLPPTVQATLARLGLPDDAFAAVALPLAHRAAAWEHRGHVAMQPGSTMKLVTSVVALDLLGPNHRGHTELRSAASLDNGRLHGDLALVGGADPELGLPQLWALLLDLRQRGVQHIEGDLLLDRSLFRPARFDQNLPPFDEAPEFPYNVIPDALFVNGNLLPFEMSAQPDGSVRASSVPPLPGLAFTSTMTLNDKRCTDWDDDWLPAAVTTTASATQIELRGAFPRGCTRRVALQLLDRSEMTGLMFRALWQGLGGSWAGQVREAAAPAGAQLLARREARPWGELLRPLNKTSDNAWTRLLYLQLGVPAMAANPQASTFELAERAVQAWFQKHGIDTDGLVMDNGSGLSRSERISAWQMARLLQVAWSGKHASELVMSLPTAGVDGTMRSRLKDSPAAGWARLKTGTLRNAVGLAGYVQDPQGRPWAVALMVNHEQAGKARPVLDAFVDDFARHGPYVLWPASFMQQPDLH